MPSPLGTTENKEGCRMRVTTRELVETILLTAAFIALLIYFT
jgi:hypothetical protein